MKGAVFFQLFSLSQWATPLCFMISFCCSLHIQSCLPRIHSSHISQKNFKDDLGHLIKTRHTGGIWHEKHIPFLPAPLPIDSYFNPIHFPSIFPFLKYLPEKLWLMCLRPSVSFHPYSQPISNLRYLLSSLWCVVHRLSFWRAMTWGIMRAIESQDIWSQHNSTAVYLLAFHGQSTTPGPVETTEKNMMPWNSASLPCIVELPGLLNGWKKSLGQPHVQSA